MMAKMTTQYGEFALEIWEDGYPVWIKITCGDQTLNFNHTSISDLEYLVKVAKKYATNALPDKYKSEV